MSMAYGVDAGKTPVILKGWGVEVWRSLMCS